MPANVRLEMTAEGAASSGTCIPASAVGLSKNFHIPFRVLAADFVSPPNRLRIAGEFEVPTTHIS
jgi:hypothetical protein